MGAREGQVVEPDAALVERVGTRRIGELVQADQGPSPEQPHDVPERPRVLIEDGLRPEQGLVPGNAAAQVAHRQRHMGDRGELGHPTSSRRASARNLNDVWRLRLAAGSRLTG